MQPNKKAVFPKKIPSFVLIGIAAGLYPLIFYYSRNFGMINSWEQFFYFLLLFVLIPTAVFVILGWILNRFITDYRRKYVFPFLSFFTFTFFIHLILYSAIQKKITLGLFIISIVFAIFLYKHFKKLIGLQLLMAFVGFIGFLPVVLKYISYSDAWTIPPDDIENVSFQKTPDVYVIQPDGYANFQELKNDLYGYENAEFESFLQKNNFKKYHNFRSNYFSTLSSNSAALMMKHHYYLNSKDNSEMLHARENIVSKNTVLSVFNNNTYKTYFLTEHPYLMVNRPKIGFDYTNFTYDEIPYLTTGLDLKKEIYPDLKKIVKDNVQPKFVFIEIFEPGHISNTESVSQGKDKEKELWLEKLELANSKVEKMVHLILRNDPQALIIIMADHGGFVGLDYTRQTYNKINDRDIIYSIFGSALAIHWPEKTDISNSEIKSSVNVFRTVFSYLADNDKYLKYTEPDKSFLIVKNGAKPGIYEYINENGEVVFEPLAKKD